MSIYRNIFIQAWQIVWKNKFLWFFGLFVSILGVGAESVFFLSAVSQGAVNGVRNIIADIGVNTWGAFSGNIINVATSYPLSFSIVVSIYILLIVLLLSIAWLIVISLIAINKETVLIYSGNNDEKNIRIGIKNSRQYFWLTLSVGYILRIAVIFLLFAIGNFYYNISIEGGAWIFVLSFVITAILIFLFGIYFKFVINYITIANDRIKESLLKAFVLLKENWLACVELSLAVYVVIFISGILAALALANIYFIFKMIAIAVAAFSVTLGFIVELVLMPLTAVLFLVWAMAIFSAFQVSSWAVFFVNLNSQGVTSKIARLTERLRR